MLLGTGSLFCLGAGRRNLGVVRTRWCEMVSAFYNTLDKNPMIFPSFCFSTERPDFTDAIILRKGASVEHVVIFLHLLHFPVCRRQFLLDLLWFVLHKAQDTWVFGRASPFVAFYLPQVSFIAAIKGLSSNYLVQPSEKAHGSNGMGLYVSWWFLCLFCMISSDVNWLLKSLLQILAQTWVFF